MKKQCVQGACFQSIGGVSAFGPAYALFVVTRKASSAGKSAAASSMAEKERENEHVSVWSIEFGARNAWFLTKANASSASSVQHGKERGGERRDS